MEASDEFKQKVRANQWDENFDEVVTAIKELSRKAEWTPEGDYAEGSNRWSWVKNGRCKYISLHIDMRDGGFTLHDRHGERISLEQLRYQYDPRPEENERGEE